MTHQISTAAALLLAATTVTGCTMKKQEAPEFTGPSEFGTSVVVGVSPDHLTQDGASQSVVTVTARDASGGPVRNAAMRAEIRVSGVVTDFGSLSARSIVTGADGRATFVYTAPPAPSPAVDNFTIVDIAVTPVGSDFANSVTRIASVRLVPPGIVIPPDGLDPYFTVAPGKPEANQTVLFDACNDPARRCAPSNNPIASYAWDFGNGRTGSGRTTTHAYAAPGFYVASLTVTDSAGRAASSSKSIEVLPGANPTAAFDFSPTAPLPNTQVNFNASSSRPAPGRTLVRYVWDFGDGTPAGNGVTVSHTYGSVATYKVTLVVTDDTGRTATTSKDVAVK